eukprot:m.255550 g.255550  ORF g.255550 m.255550 type:complete len:1226 (+) comp16181_c0_seq1:152-3829(+)
MLFQCRLLLVIVALYSSLPWTSCSRTHEIGIQQPQQQLEEQNQDIQAWLVCGDPQSSTEVCQKSWNHFTKHIFRKQFHHWAHHEDKSISDKASRHLELLNALKKEVEDSKRTLKLLHEHGESGSVKFRTINNNSRMVPDDEAMNEWQKFGASNLPVDKATYFEAKHRAVVLRLEELEQIAKQRELPATAHVQNIFRKEFGIDASVHIYESGPDMIPASAHADGYDVVIAQLKGHKTWKICMPQLDKATGESTSPLYRFDNIRGHHLSDLSPAALSLLSQLSDDPESVANSNVWEQVEDMDGCTVQVLYPGDTMYIPEGMVHFPYTTSTEGSTHVTVGLRQVSSSWGDLLLDTLERSGVNLQLHKKPPFIKSDEDDSDFEHWFWDFKWIEDGKQLVLAKYEWGALVYPLNQGDCDALYNAFSTLLQKWNVVQKVDKATNKGQSNASLSVSLHNKELVCSIADNMRNVEVETQRTRRGSQLRCNNRCRCESGCDEGNDEGCDHSCKCQTGWIFDTPFWSNDECEQCKKGTYKDGYNNKETCSECETGKYQDEIGKGDCKSCTEGQYQNEKGETSCKKCPKGQYQSEKGKKICVQCSEGHFQLDDGQSSCKECPPGQFKPNKGEGSCSLCPLGEFQPKQGQATCNSTKVCNASEYIEKNATTSSDRECKTTTTCLPGTTVMMPPSNFSNRLCSPCPRFTYNNDTALNQLSCYNKSFCGIGHFMSNEGSNTSDIKCSSCSKGQYSNVVKHRVSHCTAHDTCPSGYKHTDNRTANISCTPCEFNTYMEEDDHLNTECLPMRTCTAGTFLHANNEPAESEGVCLPCQLDDFMNETSHRERTCWKHTEISCQAGFFVHKNVTSDSSCARCPPGTYQPLDNYDLTKCEELKECGIGQVTVTYGNLTSQTVCADVVLNCDAGYYLVRITTADGSTRGVDCKQCPPETFTAINGHTSITCQNQPECGADERLVGASSTAEGVCVYNPKSTSNLNSGDTTNMAFATNSQSQMLPTASNDGFGLNGTSLISSTPFNGASVVASTGAMSTNPTTSTFDVNLNTLANNEEKKGNSSLLLYIVIPIVLLACIVVVLFIFLKARKKGNGEHATQFVSNPTYNQKNNAVYMSGGYGDDEPNVNPAVAASNDDQDFYDLPGPAVNNYDTPGLDNYDTPGLYQPNSVIYDLSAPDEAVYENMEQPSQQIYSTITKKKKIKNNGSETYATLQRGSQIEFGTETDL